MFIEQIFTLTSKECNSIYLHKSIEYILMILLYRKRQKKTIAYTHKGQRWSLLSCDSPTFTKERDAYNILFLFEHPINIVNNKRISYYVKYRQEWYHFR